MAAPISTPPTIHGPILRSRSNAKHARTLPWIGGRRDYHKAGMYGGYDRIVIFAQRKCGENVSSAATTRGQLRTSTIYPAVARCDQGIHNRVRCEKVHQCSGSGVRGSVR
jgi:hypothetical protein